MKLSILLAFTLLLELANAQLSTLRGGRPKRSLEATTANDDQASTSSWVDPFPSLMSISMPISVMGEESSYAGAAKSGKAGKAGKAVKCHADNSYPTLDLSEAFQPLRQPLQVHPDRDGVTRITLTYDLVNYKGPSFNTILRVHNGIAPSPTLHVIPGGRMEIELVNCLQSPRGFEGPEAHNLFHLPNTTNLHIHGPHISGEDPGDNSFVKVEPEGYHKYRYHFDENHMPGNFWYHPHVHGSGSLQVGQGAAGTILIDDPDDYPLPDMIKEMPQVQMVFQHMDINLLRASSEQSLDGVTNWKDHNFEVTNATTDLTNIMLVNMQFLPVVTMEVGKWYRWRMVISSIQNSLAFLSESGNCEFQLLAKDGIYLSDAPRKVPVIILSPGNKADVAVRCNQIGQERMNTTSIGIPQNFNPSEQYMMDEDLVEDHEIPDLVGTFADPEAQPTIMVIDVVKSSRSGRNTGDTDLKPFTVPTPCYLVDLRSLNDTEIDGTFTNVYPMSRNGVFGVLGPYGIGGDESYFLPWVNMSTYINDFAVGTVQDIVYKDSVWHPYHQHVNPFQIQKIDHGGVAVEFEESASIWYQVGDWHDSLQLPAGPATSVNIRFQADQFTGHMIQHCHILHHHDKGMMAQYKITGEEYTVWDGAQKINPTCILPSGPMKNSDKEEEAYFELLEGSSLSM